MNNTTIKFHSHACLSVSHGGKTLMTDPWLIGSCYWRSWWNYPPVRLKNIDFKSVDAIYITHVHWDHWHGPSLKKLFPKDILIITHEEPNCRSYNDLLNIGFKNIKLLKHGESFSLGQITIIPYQFGLFLNDSALVIKTPRVNIFNANDCKIAGPALRFIINRHGPFDFALRSHSSANDRICYSIDGSDKLFDDDEHYSRAFGLFMKAVRPRYAIPFASNHCHLHKDVYHLNSYINDPFKLRNYFDTNGIPMKGIELKVMLTGDYWTSDEGFVINSINEDFFNSKESFLLDYKNKMGNKLEEYYSLENRLKPNERIIKKFSNQIRSIPKIFRLSFSDFKYKMILFNDFKEYVYTVEPKTGAINYGESDCSEDAVVRIPIKIFFDAVSMNMFHHSSISKRNSYIFKNEHSLKVYERFQDLLELVELEVFPLSFGYVFRFLKSYLRRWREVLVYLKAVALKSKKMPIYYIEEEILRET